MDASGVKRWKKSHFPLRRPSIVTACLSYPEAMLGRRSSRYRTIGHAPDDVFEMTV